MSSWFSALATSPLRFGDEDEETSKQHWMPDAIAPKCYECESPFTLLLRRHHCRSCGRVFCHRCCPVIDPAGNSKYRLCSFCRQRRMGQQDSKRNHFNATEEGTSNHVGKTTSSSVKDEKPAMIDIISRTLPRGIRTTIIEENSQTIVMPGEGNSSAELPEKGKSRRSSVDAELESRGSQSRDSDISSSYSESMGILRSKTMPSKPATILTESMGEAVMSGIDVYNNSNRMEASQMKLQDEEYSSSSKDRSLSASRDSEGNYPISSEDVQSANHLSLPKRTSSDGSIQNADCGSAQKQGIVDRMRMSLRINASAKSAEGSEKESEFLKLLETVPLDYLEVPTTTDTSIPNDNEKEMEKIISARMSETSNAIFKNSGVDCQKWCKVVSKIALNTAMGLSLEYSSFGDAMDCLQYIKIKKIPVEGSESHAASENRTFHHQQDQPKQNPAEASTLINGIVFRKNVANRRMPTFVDNPRILLLSGSLEFARVLERFSSIDAVLEQERAHLHMTCRRILSLKPTVVVVEKSVAAYARDILLEKRISLLLGVKHANIRRISRATGASILSSVDDLLSSTSTENISSLKLGDCKSFAIKRMGDKTLSVFDGCPHAVEKSVLLTGADENELQKVKALFKHCLYAANHLLLESSFRRDISIDKPPYLGQVSNDRENEKITMSVASFAESDPNLSEHYSLRRIVFYKRTDVPLGLFLYALFSEGLPNKVRLYCYENFRIILTVQKMCSDADRETQICSDDEASGNDVADKSSQGSYTDRHSGKILCWTSSLKMKIPGVRRLLSQEGKRISFGKFLQICFSPESILADNFVNFSVDQNVAVFYREKINVLKIKSFSRLLGSTIQNIGMEWTNLELTGITKIAKEIYNIVDELGTRLLVIISKLKSYDGKLGNKTLTQICANEVQRREKFESRMDDMQVTSKEEQSILHQRMEKYSEELKSHTEEERIDKLRFSSVQIRSILSATIRTWVSLLKEMQMNAIEIERGYALHLSNQKPTTASASKSPAVAAAETHDTANDLGGRALHSNKSLDKNQIKPASEEDAQNNKHKRSSSESAAQDIFHGVEDLSLTGSSAGSEENISATVTPASKSLPDPEKDAQMNTNTRNLEEECTVEAVEDRGEVLSGKDDEDERKSIGSQARMVTVAPLITLDRHLGKVVALCGESRHCEEDARTAVVYESEISSMIAAALASFRRFVVQHNESSKDETKSVKSDNEDPSSIASRSASSDSEGDRKSVGENTDDDPVTTARRANLISNKRDFKVLIKNVGFGLKSSTENYDEDFQFSVIAYYWSQFENVRKYHGISEDDFELSLARCFQWKPRGGKSKAYFAKSFDERFVIKQLSKAELYYYNQYASSYFEYIREDVSTGRQSILSRIFGLYHIETTSRSLRMYVVIMDNVFYDKKPYDIFDLKGSLRRQNRNAQRSQDTEEEKKQSGESSQYDSSIIPHSTSSSALKPFVINSSTATRVNLDECLVDQLFRAPIFLDEASRYRLYHSICVDTKFLQSQDIMDYSLLAGICKESDSSETLTVAIIDYLRPYTWDKQLETLLKSRAVFSQSPDPTVISPKQYRKRFLKAMLDYFVVVPDSLSPRSFTDEEEYLSST